MKNTTLLLSILILTTAFLNSCTKKSNDDPSVSFRTRKNRVVGDWKAESGNMTITNQTGQASYNIDGNKFEYHNGPFIDYGTATISYEFKKDGNCSIRQSLGGYLYSVTGTWNFTDGIGERKKKTQLVIHVIDYSGPSGSQSNKGNETDITYDIEELRNEKMRLSMVDEYTDKSNAYTESYTENWTLILKLKQ